MKSFNHKIILASNSPRRKELLAGLDIDFEVRVMPDIDEHYPDGLTPDEVPQYLARHKAEAYLPTLKAYELVITADTVVVVDDRILGKPADLDEARTMLRLLSGRTHHVVTGVCLTTQQRQKVFAVTTEVSFGELSDDEINYYVERYRPLDKAGAYGIQEWIGHVGVSSLHGSYFNVVGFPVQRIYQEIKNFQ